MDLGPVSVYIPGCPDDPRDRFEPPPGVVARRGPPLHPDDRSVVDGIPVTSPSRTLIDLAETMDVDELRACFVRAGVLGLLDIDALRAARDRVEWRPSLPVVDALIAEFAGHERE